VAARLGPTGTVVLFDLDPANLKAAAERLRAGENPPVVHTVHASFVQAPRRMAELGLRADLVLADLGFASSQMSDPSRGLSFMNDGPLDMRLDPTSPITAAELVNSLSEQELAQLLREFGEEPNAGRIARKLVQERGSTPIQTTAHLARIVRAATPARAYSGIDPATRSFQALRIAVNDEIGNLTGLLSAIGRAAAAARKGEPTWLAPSARIAIISFHSLEDRPVKHAFAALEEKGLATPLTRKPVQADEAELATNPRARSAKMRAVRLT
jgi:16S rRNA (cytosine1402-N4)-methyltransferase